MLKLAQEGSDNEKIALLQSLLEDAGRRTSELETENRSEPRLLCCPPGGRSSLCLTRAPRPPPLSPPQAGESASYGGAESGGGAAEVSAGAGIQLQRREFSLSTFDPTAAAPHPHLLGQV